MNVEEPPPNKLFVFALTFLLLFFCCWSVGGLAHLILPKYTVSPFVFGAGITACYLISWLARGMPSSTD